MVTLSLTRSRIAGVLRRTAELLEVDGWDPASRSVIFAIDRAAGYTPGSGNVDAEDATLAAWDALVTQLGDVPVTSWEQAPGRTQAEVLAMVRAAAKAVRP